MARIEVESGNYPEAERWIRRLPADKSIEETVLFPAIIALALQGNGTAAERLFDTATESWDRSWWLFDLRVRLANNPEDRAAAQEIQRLTRLSSPQSLQELIGVRQPKEQGPRAGSATSVAELYKVHCRACHGTGGDGHGPAARNLFPRPRNLRSGKSQLVSTRNGVPTLEDLQRMLAQGMPGTSMAAFDKLPAADRRLLAEEVLRLRREGIQEEVARALQQEGEEIDRAELRQTVERLTTPGERVRLPGDWPALQQAAERGKVSYRTLGCNKCHGDDGIGAADQPLFDEQGEPARARDLVHEPFKGGRDLESVYLRIAAGMPGTAHPAAWNLPQDQVTEVAAFVRSLARGPERMLTNFERRMRSASRAYLAWINQSSGESPEAGEKHVLVPAGRIDQEHP
jgi:mono/diheme cytochrome c family protein